MLTKRTNILFSEELWKKLLQLAEAKKTSVGEFVRRAVEEKYTKEAEFEQTKQLLERIEKIRPKPFKGAIDYKALINYGRK